MSTYLKKYKTIKKSYDIYGNIDIKSINYHLIITIKLNQIVSRVVQTNLNTSLVNSKNIFRSMGLSKNLFLVHLHTCSKKQKHNIAPKEQILAPSNKNITLLQKTTPLLQITKKT